MLTSGAATLAASAFASSLSRNAQAADVPGATRPREGSAAATGARHAAQDWLPPGQPGRDYRPVVVPNGAKLPWKVVDGVKVFHLVAEEVEHEFAPGLKATCWGYNGHVHGPTIEAVEGDRVRIYVTNRLPAPTTVHWHGILLPNGMDGVGGLNQKAIQPGETFKYEFTLRQTGTGMYHSHHDEMTQMGLGMTGMFIIHPRRPRGPRVDRDFALMLHEWRIDVGAEAARSERDDRLQRAHHQRQGVPGHRPAGRQEGAARAHPHRQPERHGSPPDPFARLPVPHHRDRRRRDPAFGAMARNHGARARSAARARSSSWPTNRATGRCTAT